MSRLLRNTDTMCRSLTQLVAGCHYSCHYYDDDDDNLDDDEEDNDDEDDSLLL